jgi:hypothetical protein
MPPCVGIFWSQDSKSFTLYKQIWINLSAYFAVYGSRAVKGMYCLRSLGGRDRGLNPTKGMDV